MAQSEELASSLHNQPAGRLAAFDAPVERNTVVGALTCPQCGTSIQYVLRQIGREVDCAACGLRSIRVGQSLVDEISRPRAPLRTSFAVLLVPRRAAG